jgi:hypothetical protein
MPALTLASWLLVAASAIPPAAGRSIDAEDCDSLASEPVSNTIDFHVDIQPLLDERCAPCHTQGSFGGMNLQAQNVREHLLGASGGGAASGYPGFLRVAPGDPAASLLFLRLNCTNAGTVDNPIPRMPPPDGTGTDLQALIHDWIALGAILRSDDPALRSDRVFLGRFETLR